MLLPYSVSSLNILITSVLNSASDRLVISVSFSIFFSGVLFYSFIWAIFICLLNLAVSLFCFCVLGRTAVTPCLSSVAYCRKGNCSPGWCGSVDWVLACEAKGHWFNSQPGHMPGLQSKSPLGGAWVATTHWCFSPSLSPSLPLSKNR